MMFELVAIHLPYGWHAMRRQPGTLRFVFCRRGTAAEFQIPNS
jgi:hypothetical protein